MTLLEKYLHGYDILKNCIEGLTPEQMKTVLGMGKRIKTIRTQLFTLTEKEKK